MFNPPHPGEIIKEDILPSLNLTVTQAAQQLGITRVALSRVINGKAAISTDLALRLEDWMDGPTAEVWLGMQMDYEIWRERQKPRPKIERSQVVCLPVSK
jgi:addiction module HigA family antidote